MLHLIIFYTYSDKQTGEIDKIITKETQETYNTQLTNLLDGIADKYDIAPERVEKFRNGL